MSGYDSTSHSEWYLRRCVVYATGRFATKYWSILLLILVASSLTGRPTSAAGAETSTPAGARAASPGSSAVLKDTYAFPITPVGQSSTSCRALCSCTDTSHCNCNASGTLTIEHSLAPPFNASGYLIQPYANGAIDCRSGTPVQLPAFLNAGQQLAYTVSFSPSRPGAFSDYLRISGYTLSLSGSTPRGSSSLVPYQPAGWSAPVVVSRTQGTQIDSPTLTGTEPLYISWAVLNAGDLSAFGAFYIDLYLDGRLLQRWVHQDDLSPNFYTYVKDYKIGPLAPGAHMLDLVPDSTNSTLGSSQSYKKMFTVTQGTPTLRPPPPPTTSWYVYVTSDEKDEALNSWMYNIGYQYGQNAVSPDGFVVVDFGQPWQSGNSYGTWSFNARFGRFLSTATIREAVKQYIRGFIVGAATAGKTGRLWLGVGTNNSGSYVTAVHGKAWASMMTALQTWLDASGVTQKVFLRAASDIELGYSTPEKASSWIDAYNASNSFNFLYNYGDAQGCPQSGATDVSQKCSGKVGWTQDKVIRSGLLLPEIYATSGGNAKQWQQLVLYYKLRYNSMRTVFGAMSQKQACQQRGGCQGTDNSPTQAWMQMRDRLASDPRTYSIDPFFSTDIKWRK